MYKIKGSFVFGKAKIRVVKRLAGRVSKVVCASGLQLKEGLDSVNWWSGRAISAMFSK